MGVVHVIYNWWSSFRMDQIKFYLNHRHVPEHLQDQIKRWAEYTWVR